jgi:hypothetical protein
MVTEAQVLWVQKTLGVTGLAQPANGATTAGGGADDASGGGMFDDIKNFVIELFTGEKAVKPADPVPRVELGQAQTDRSDKLLAAMSKDDQAKVGELLEKAKPDEKKYLQKALASSHSAAELDAFYKQIEGKDKAWMDVNLHVVGDSQGNGIKQQWECSCGPTTIQAMKGELDPIYALKLRTDNPHLTEAKDDDAMALNPNMAADQKSSLVGHGGVATNRDTDGAGISLGGALNEQKGVTGLKFDTETVPDDKFDARLAELDSALSGGLPVPIRVSSPGASGGHFVLVVGGEQGPPRVYSIHDPWDGKIIKASETDIKAKKLNIAGWTQITHIYKPSADVPAVGS